jgi:hypothetical protein
MALTLAPAGSAAKRLMRDGRLARASCASMLIQTKNIALISRVIDDELPAGAVNLNLPNMPCAVKQKIHFSYSTMGLARPDQDPDDRGCLFVSIGSKDDR